MRLLYRFPEIYRETRLELNRTRVLAGVFTVTVVYICLGLASRIAADPGASILRVALIGQALVLLVYGTQRTASSVSAERVDRTWDFQRMTPLTSFEVAAGKLIGAPLYAYFLALVIAPWPLVAAAASPVITLGRVLMCWAVLLSAAFVLLSLGLFISALTEKGPDRGGAHTGGALIALAGLYFLAVGIGSVGRPWQGAPFYGLDVPLWIFYVASALAFGGWAFAGAKWRIGRDFLESPRFWRFPAFLMFLWAWFLGLTFETLTGAKAGTALIPSLLFAYIGSFLQSERRDEWRAWLSGPGEGRLNRTPLWLAAWLTVCGLALVTAGGVGVNAVRLCLLFPLFMGRDLMFLQWCRLTGARKPEAMAVAYILLAYVLPFVVFGIARYKHAFFLFAPVTDSTIGPLVNLLPGLLQAGGMAALLWIKTAGVLRRKA